MTINDYDNFSRHLEMTEKLNPNYWPYIIGGFLVVGLIVLILQKPVTEKDKNKAVEG